MFISLIVYYYLVILGLREFDKRILYSSASYFV